MADFLRIEEAGGLIIAPDWGAVAKLMAKLAKASSLIRGVEQDGINQDQKYRFISYQEVASAVRAALSEAGVAFMVNLNSRVDSTGQSKSGSIYQKVVLEGTLTFADGEGGGMWCVHVWGDGVDYQDKALSKAITSLVKYPLMRIFLLSSRDDVDADETDGPSPAKGNGAAKPAPKPVEPAVAPVAAPEKIPPAPAAPETPSEQPEGEGNGHEPDKAPAPAKGNVGWSTWGKGRQDGFWIEAGKVGLDKETIHREFAVDSMTQYIGSNTKVMTLLHLLDFGFKQALSLDEIHTALGVTFMNEFDGDVRAGHALFAIYLTRASQKEAAHV